MRKYWRICTVVGLKQHDKSRKVLIWCNFYRQHLATRAFGGFQKKSGPALMSAANDVNAGTLSDSRSGRGTGLRDSLFKSILSHKMLFNCLNLKMIFFARSRRAFDVRVTRLRDTRSNFGQFEILWSSCGGAEVVNGSDSDLQRSVKPRFGFDRIASAQTELHWCSCCWGKKRNSRATRHERDSERLTYVGRVLRKSKQKTDTACSLVYFKTCMTLVSARNSIHEKQLM